MGILIIFFVMYERFNCKRNTLVDVRGLFKRSTVVTSLCLLNFPVSFTCLTLYARLLDNLSTDNIVMTISSSLEENI